jgi:phage-related holin
VIKVRSPLLTVEYTATYVCNRSISSTRGFYGLADDVLCFIVVALSPCISRAFTLRGDWNFK